LVAFLKKKTAVTVFVFDEWVSLPFREVLGVGDCGGDERDLLMASIAKRIIDIDKTKAVMQ